MFFILFISCVDQKQQAISEGTIKPLMSIPKKHQKTASVKPSFLKDVENWNHLKLVDSFFVKYRKISPNEALSNALELKDLVQSLKDSIKPKIFNTPSFNTRVNVLYNETLRLVDLIDISAIQAEEVNLQVDKTMEAFSSVNLKINTVLLKRKFEDEMLVEVNYIGLDTTKIDSVSRKSIDLRLKEKLAIKNKPSDNELRKQ